MVTKTENKSRSLEYAPADGTNAAIENRRASARPGGSSLTKLTPIAGVAEGARRLVMTHKRHLLDQLVGKQNWNGYAALNPPECDPLIGLQDLVWIDSHDHVDDPVSGDFGECMRRVCGNDDHVPRSDLTALSIQDFWSKATRADKR
jgi:hypothetical protein